MQMVSSARDLLSLDQEALTAFYKRRQKAAKQLLHESLHYLPAEVIYRPNMHWDSFIWINVGSQDVAPNSPVLKGGFLIGLVESVEPSRSRVRLITDASLAVSVRVARKGEYLAKGELKGALSTEWRGRSYDLLGVGFNYDFPDEEGDARDFQSGMEHSQLQLKRTLSLIEVGDLLVTTGMDGLFPKDIPVATVTARKTPKEGETSVDIEARLCAGSLNYIEDVIVLPPLANQEETI